MKPKSWGSSSGGKRSTRFSNPWGGGSVSGGSSSYGIAGGSTEDSGYTAGGFSVNPADPVGSAYQMHKEGTEWLGGMKDAIFGTSQPDFAGDHGGLLGDLPGIGAGGRFLSETVSNAGAGLAQLPGAAADVIGGSFEHIDFRSDVENEVLQKQWDQLSPANEFRRAAEAQIAKDPGATGHYMSKAIRQANVQMQDTNAKPDLWGGLYAQPGSAADTIENLLFGFFGVAQRGTERLIAGTDRAGGTNRLEETLLRAKGYGSSGLFSGSAELTPVEKLVVQKYTSGEWGETEALDYMASHGAGLSHDQALQIAGSFATDPTNALSFGAAGAAKLGMLGVRLSAKASNAERALVAAIDAGEDLTEAKKMVALAQGGIRGNNTAARLNILGKLAEKPAAADLVRTVTKPYVAMQGTYFGKAAKTVRTVIDPFHALDLKRPSSSALLDVMADAAPKAFVGGFGDIAHAGLLHALDDIDPSRGLLDQFNKAISYQAAYALKQVAAENHVASQLLANMPGNLIGTIPDEIMDDLLKQAPKAFTEAIRERAARFRVRELDEAIKDTEVGQAARRELATRVASQFKYLDEPGWMKRFESMSGDQLSMLHAASHQLASGRLRKIRDSLKLVGDLAGKKNRLHIMRKDTLTRLGAEGLLKRLEGATDTRVALDEIRDAQKKYRELRGLRLDDATPNATVDYFIKSLTRRLVTLPGQVLDDELKANPELAALNDEIGEAFTIGFRPDDDYLWGIERVDEAGGGYRPISDPWVDAIDEAPVWNAGRQVSTNILGQPIIGAIARGAAKTLDWVEAGGRATKMRVSGTMVAEAARSKFISRAVAKYGFSEAEARKVHKALEDHIGLQDIVVNPRGLRPTNMWKAVAETVPPTVAARGFGPHEMMRLVLDAYDGDVRFIGITQKFTGRVKSMLGPITGNAPAVISENLYPTIKYRLNPIFQLQERVEPIILTAQRGATVAAGTKLNEADRQTAAMLDRFANSGINRMADVEMGEYQAVSLHARAVEDAATNTDTALGRIKEASAAFADVRGAKRINLLRTFRHGLAKELKPIWERSNPGLWDEMHLRAQALQEGLLSEDDFALSIMAEHMMGNDIMVRRVEGALKRFAPAEYKAAIAPGRWSLPSDLGELQNLGLNDVAQMLRLPMSGGRATSTMADLREGLQAGSFTMDDIKNVLRVHNADPDYIRRVERSLEFSWEEFWGEATKRYGLSKQESRQLQDIVGGSAELRGMTPIDYLSQIFRPKIKDISKGEVDHVGALGSAVDMIRGDGLAALNAPAGSTRTDLINQLSSAFSAHLDPSAKRALLLEFNPDLRRMVMEKRIAFGLDEVETMWDTKGRDALSAHLLGRADGVLDPGSPRIARSFDELAGMFDDEEFKVRITGEDDYGIETTREYHFIGGIGDNLRSSLTTKQQQQIAEIISSWRLQFPDIPLRGIEMPPDFHISRSQDGMGQLPGTDAMVAGVKEENSVLLLSPDIFKAERATARKAAAKAYQDKTGLRWAVSDDPLGIIYHELGHLVDSKLREAIWWDEGIKALAPYYAFIDKHSSTIEALTGYAKSSKAKHEDDFEGMAELFDLAFNPAHYAKLSPEHQQIARELRQVLQDLEVFTPVQATPDVERVARQFSAWTQKAVAQAMTKGSKSRFSQVLTDVARIPTEGGSAYNQSEALMITAATNSMKSKWDDAYRLQYYAQTRSFLERTINHPMFGIYPASYMWGKILPEMVRFVATTPFGVQTGGVLYSTSDVIAAIGMQRELDPEFDKLIEDLGHSNTMWMLGYLLPSTPWDVSAAMPGWTRDLAKQGNDNRAVVESGGEAGGVDLLRSLGKATDIMNPLRPVKQVESVTDELIGEEGFFTPDDQGSSLAQQPVAAVDLGPSLEYQMQQLRDELGS